MIRWKRNVFNRIFNVALGIFLSGTIRMRQLKSNLGDLTIHKDSELDCDFGGRCRWFSERATAEEGGRLAPWNVAEGTPDAVVWFAATATNRQPVSPFGYLALANGKGEMLTSAILPCQAGAGLLTFEYWLSSSASGFVCVLAADSGAQIHCSHPLQRSPGHATIKILGPILKPFKLAIIGTGQGFIIVDNIRYSGEVVGQCPEPSLLSLPASTTAAAPVFNASSGAVTSKALSLRGLSSSPAALGRLGPGVSVWGYEDRRNHSFLETADALTCDFVTAEYDCRWGPKEGDWSLVDGSVSPSALESVLGAGVGPTFPAVALTHRGTLIVSDPIVCQKNDAQVIVSWWGSQGASLRVCAVSFPQGVEIVCAPERRPREGDYPGPLIFEFKGNIFGPFIWQISGTWPGGEEGLLLLDDIAYFGEICAISPYFAVTEEEATTAEPIVVFTEAPTTTTEEPTTTTALSTTESDWWVHTSRWLPPHLRRFRLTTPAPTPPPPPPTTTLDASLPSTCDLLNCDFDEDTCRWSGVGIGSSHWRRLTRPFGIPLSRLTDIRVSKSSGGFLATQLHPSHNRLALVASPRLPQGGIKIFQFKFYRASRGVTLKLCGGSRRTRLGSDFFRSCQRIVPELSVRNARKWNTARALILPQYTRLYLLAEHRGSNGHAAIAIDDLRVLNC